MRGPPFEGEKGTAAGAWADRRAVLGILAEAATGGKQNPALFPRRRQIGEGLENAPHLTTPETRSAHPQLRHLLLQALPVNAEPSGGGGDVAAAGVQGRDDHA